MKKVLMWIVIAVFAVAFGFWFYDTFLFDDSIGPKPRMEASDDRDSTEMVEDMSNMDLEGLSTTDNAEE